MKKSFWLPILFLCSLSCRASGPQEAQTPRPSVYDRKVADEALEAKEYQDFLHQSNKDELLKLTENSFFDSKLKPLAGSPVLLAAGVKTWDKRRGESDESPNVVKFEIVQGKGTLAFFTEYIPGQGLVGLPKGELETLAMDGYQAFVWLITGADSHDEVVVRASLAPMGARAAFIDTKSDVLFHVQPVELRPEYRNFDVRKICSKVYVNDSILHTETDQNFIFTYPSSRGVYHLDPTASIYTAGQVKLFRKDSKGLVIEAEKWEEKRIWEMEREKWHTIPPDLQGFLTHVDEAGKHWGILTYTHYDPAYGGQGNDQFEQSRWILGKYLANTPEAGPEDQWVFRTQQEDPNSPITVEPSRTHHANLGKDHGMSFWGETVHWISSAGNIGSIYDLLFKRRIYFQAAVLPSEENIKANLAGITGVENKSEMIERPVNDFLKTLGFSFQDITGNIESRFIKVGHPPGAIVISVESKSPAASLGLLPDDVIIMANWEQTTHASELRKVLAKIPADETLTLIFWRRGSYHWLQIP